MSTNFSDVPIRENGTLFNTTWVNTLRAAGIVVEAVVTAISATVTGIGVRVTNLENALFQAQIDAISAIITAIIGAGGSGTPLSCLIDNSASATAILTLNSAYRRHTMDYVVLRAATATVAEVGQLVAWFDGATWYIARSWFSGDAGITFDIVSGTGVVNYSTDTMAGTYDATSKMDFTLKTLG
jgi:hypothetical protein